MAGSAYLTLRGHDQGEIKGSLWEGEGGFDSSSRRQPRGQGTYKVSVTLTSRAGTSTTRVFTGQTMSRNGSSLARASIPVVVR